MLSLLLLLLLLLLKKQELLILLLLLQKQLLLILRTHEIVLLLQLLVLLLLLLKDIRMLRETWLWLLAWIYGYLRVLVDRTHCSLILKAHYLRSLLSILLHILRVKLRCEWR